MKLLSIIAFLSFVTIGVNAQFHSIELKTSEGEWSSVDALKGEQLTVIDFWATFCKPCIKAMPKLNKLSNKYKGQGVQFIGVSIDGPRNQAKIRPLIRATGVQYPILLDVDKELMNEYQVQVMPTLIILNKKGKVVFIHEGFQPGDGHHISEVIEKHLNKE